MEGRREGMQLLGPGGYSGAGDRRMMRHVRRHSDSFAYKPGGGEGADSRGRLVANKRLRVFQHSQSTCLHRSAEHRWDQGEL